MAGRKSITETGDAGAQPVPEVVEFTMASIVTGPAGFTSLPSAAWPESNVVAPFFFCEKLSQHIHVQLYDCQKEIEGESLHVAVSSLRHLNVGGTCSSPLDLRVIHLGQHLLTLSSSIQNFLCNSAPIQTCTAHDSRH
jgi:hypothetical protein